MLGVYVRPSFLEILYIHGRILAREPGGPRKGKTTEEPLERESIGLAPF